MTLPDERSRALLAAETVLAGVMHGKLKGKEAREMARWALRHYPTLVDLVQLAERDRHAMPERPILDADLLRLALDERHAQWGAGKV